MKGEDSENFPNLFETRNPLKIFSSNFERQKRRHETKNFRRIIGEEIGELEWGVRVVKN